MSANRIVSLSIPDRIAVYDAISMLTGGAKREMMTMRLNLWSGINIAVGRGSNSDDGENRQPGRPPPFQPTWPDLQS